MLFADDNRGAVMASVVPLEAAVPRDLSAGEM